MSTAAPADWRVSPDQTVPLSDVARSARQHGVSYDAVSAAARNGLLDVVRVGGPGVRGAARRITLASALLALAIAKLCQMLEVAFTTLLRTARETGAQLAPDGALTFRIMTAA